MTAATAISRKASIVKRSNRSKQTLALKCPNKQEACLELPVGKRRRVTFNPRVEIKQFSSNQNDMKESWYSGEDYTVFENDCTNTINAIRKAFSLRQKGNNKAEYRLNPEEYTAKGLEDLLSIELKRHRGFLKGRHHHHVLTEHKMQRSHGIVNMDQLAAVSEMFSSENCHMAIERGNTRDY